MLNLLSHLLLNIEYLFFILIICSLYCLKNRAWLCANYCRGRKNAFSRYWVKSFLLFPTDHQTKTLSIWCVCLPAFSKHTISFNQTHCIDKLTSAPLKMELDEKTRSPSWILIRTENQDGVELEGFNERICSCLLRNYLNQLINEALLKL